MGGHDPITINIVTIFPEFFETPLATSIPGRAAEAGLVRYRVVDLRAFTTDRHQTVDDTPYGGGAGMVLKPEPFFDAVDSLATKGPVVLLSARGKIFSHEDAVRYAVQPDLTLLCGHYKDVDQRVADHLATEEISLGRFVLSGGEIGALAVADSVVRLLPGAMGDHDSATTDSFYDGASSVLPPSHAHRSTGDTPSPRSFSPGITRKSKSGERRKRGVGRQSGRASNPLPARSNPARVAPTR